MKCPHCDKELEVVRVLSESWQYGELDKSGKITNYGHTEDILGTHGIECPHCSGDLMGVVRED